MLKTPSLDDSSLARFRWSMAGPDRAWSLPFVDERQTVKIPLHAASSADQIDIDIVATFAAV